MVKGWIYIKLLSKASSKQATLQGAGLSTGSWELGIEPPTLRLVDDPIYLLSLDYEFK